MSDETQIITLKHPIKMGDGTELRQITMRRPKVKDLRAIAKQSNEIEQGIALMTLLSGLVPEDFDLLDFEDFTAINECVAPWLKGAADPKK